jgi:hypothetical protein
MKSDFEERKTKRQQRFETAAENAKRKADQAFRTSDAITDMIPFGQPILVGHHSEKRHRRAIDKSHNAMRKGIEESEKAKYYEQRAKSVESNTAIFSDDPNATERLAEKIERLEKRQELMKAANKLVRKDDYDGLLEMGFTEKQVTDLLTPSRFGGGVGFPSYAITNNGANIRRLKERLETELKKAAMETTSIKYDCGVTLTQNAEDNRTQIEFPTERVSKEIYTLLKRNGFRRTREGIWQRHLSNGATYAAQDIIKKFAEEVKANG